MFFWFLFSTFLFHINGNSYGCPTNVTCFEKETCCETSTGLWACCPIESGVCCDDGLHCCPKDHQCLSNGNCTLNNQTILPIPLKQQSNDVPCPDGSSACPDGNTCCLLESGDYGCCPLVDAVCCSDYIHCCPHGYQCDVEKGQCLQDISIPWFTKQAAIQKKPKDHSTKLHNIQIKSKENTEIICPDATSLCPSTSSCCLTKELVYDCCPIEHAICCSDHIHCCPAHYKCDLHIFKCDHDISNPIPLLKKEKSIKKLSKRIQLSNNHQISTIQCPDTISYCPEETTCCQLEDGSYGCCPYPDGSCCSDKIHCCGNGYSCDISGKRCIRNLNELNQTDNIILSKRKLQPFILLNKKEDQLCPDNITKCSLTTTCCPNPNTNPVTYSCCPYSKGVCCGTNGSVCCPNNYQCDDKQLSCQLKDLNHHVRNKRLDIDYNQCGGSDFGCSNDQTCCRTFGSSDGDYACCTLPNAQCCDDGRHCCPQGTKCDTQYGGCVQDN